jgi:hypothetical protein
MKYKIYAAAYFSILCFASFAEATDFRCTDTAASLASLPPELRQETSMVSISQLATLTTPQVDTVASNTRPNFSRIRMIRQPDEFQEAAGRDGGVRASVEERLVLRNKFNPLGEGVRTPPKFRDDKPPIPDTPQDPEFVLPSHLRKVPGMRIDSRVVDRDTALVAAGLNQESTSQNLNTLKNAFQQFSSCDATVVGDWEELDETIDARRFPQSPEALARAFYENKEKFIKDHEARDVATFTAYLAATRTLLERCFSPAEQGDFEARHHALKQIGRLTYGNSAECTATIIGDGQYVITARHCFRPLIRSPNLAVDIWFKPSSSEHRYAVCAIADTDALLPNKISSAESDQVLVRVAPTGIKPQPVKIAVLDDIMTTADGKMGKNAAPTLLASVSYFPLAPVVYPDKFRSGYVSATSVCAATAKGPSCFSHICSAVAGGSGSPIFEAAASGITLVGTHVGGSADVGQSCQQARGVQTNTAAAINTMAAPQFFHNASQ